MPMATYLKTRHKADMYQVIPLLEGGIDYIINIVPLPRKEHIRKHQEAGILKVGEAKEIDI